MVSDVDGTSDIRKGLTDARKIMRSKSPDKDEAIAEVDKSLAALADDLKWRKKGEAELLPALNTYDEAIKYNIGLRSQPRLPKDMALDVAACLSPHRDISLNF